MINDSLTIPRYHVACGHGYDNVEGMDSPLKGDSEADCDVCNISKAHRQSMKITENRKLEPMDM
jgi:hypothetical protein